MPKPSARDWVASEQGKHFCQCGCGQAVVIKIHHHARGIPRFVKGHYSRVFNPQTGRKSVLNPHWKGGRYVGSSGYVYVLNPERTSDRDRYVAEHRLVMERHLGRRLLPTEDVHHRNGDKSDNRIENLVVLTKEEHAQLHDGCVRERLGPERYAQAKRGIHLGIGYREMLRG